MSFTKKQLFGAIAILFVALFVGEQFGFLSAVVSVGATAVASIGGTMMTLPTRVTALEMRMVGVENKLEMLTNQVSRINDNLIDLGRKVEANMNAANQRMDSLNQRLDTTLNAILHLVMDRRPSAGENCSNERATTAP